MKNRSILLFAVIAITLVFLQFSCATQKQAETQPGSPAALEVAKPAEEAPAKPAETAPAVAQPAAAALLADKHKTSGVSCSDCHKETPPASEPGTDVCMTCHQDYRDKATSSVDPHNAHMSYSNCGDCHHGHKASENQCQQCHNFGVTTP